MAGALLRLVHSLERRRAGLPFVAHIELTAPGPSGPRVLASLEQTELAPRAFVIGSGERVDVTAPGGLLPRHIAVVVVPTPQGVLVRALTLHPEHAMTVHADGAEPLLVGSAEAFGQLRLRFDGFELTIDAHLHQLPTAPEPEGMAVFPPGEQLGFYQGSTLKPVGNVVSSISGPGGGGHAIPALVMGMPEPESAGTLVLHGRSGVHRLEPTWTELRRGVLIGRSRRCVLGRGFDENDGLSRVHALCMMIDTGVYVFDLASRYGLRDVARPTRVMQAARLDNGTGCLVYGAGHLLFEA